MDWLVSIFDIRGFGWEDVLDIVLVTGLVYGLIVLLRRTRGAPVAIGILGFLALWWVATNVLELQTLGTLLDLAVLALPFVVVLLFQNTIRRAFMTLGRNPLFRFVSTAGDESMVENVCLAALSLAARSLGAIIVIEREVGLRNFAESGIPIDAKLSYELLVALFQKTSPLHDGAVIVTQDRINAAACLLPLTQKPQPVKYGSRHRAALGLSDETDAAIIVVSEERGTIAVVRDGEVRSLEAKELRDYLRRELGTAPQAERGRAAVVAG
jgi:diadenylate cyclase